MLRRREGHALRVELERHLDFMRGALDSIDAAVPTILERHHKKLHERVQQLIASAGSRVAPERLEHEIAILADKMDVTEELARARAHVGLFAALMESDDAIGRKLDFVTQEMLREANTIGSKVADADVAHRVIELKSTIERLREQVQNVV